MTSDRSVPLSEAQERFSDPSEWNELRSFEAYALAVIWMGSPETEIERKCLRYQELRQRLETELVARLEKGSLVATGCVLPVGLNLERQVIPSTRWRLLKPDFKTSEAMGAELHIIDIHVEDAHAAHVRCLPSEPPSCAKLRADVRKCSSERRARAVTAGRKSTVGRPRVNSSAIE